MIRQPVDLLIVRQHVVFELSRLDKPAFPRVLDERIIVGSPAERILVLILLLMIEPSVLFHPPHDRFVGVFDPLPGKVREPHR